MRDEVTSDCATKEGKRWFNVKSQQTGLRSGVNHQPLSMEHELLLLRHTRFTEILTERRDGKGEWGEKARREREKKKCRNKMDKEVLWERDWFHKPFSPYPITMSNPSRLALSIWHVDYIGQKEGNGRGRRMRARYLPRSAIILC